MQGKINVLLIIVINQCSAFAHNFDNKLVLTINFNFSASSGFSVKSFSVFVSLYFLVNISFNVKAKDFGSGLIKSTI